MGNRHAARIVAATAASRGTYVAGLSCHSQLSSAEIEKWPKVCE